MLNNYDISKKREDLNAFNLQKDIIKNAALFRVFHLALMRNEHLEMKWKSKKRRKFKKKSYFNDKEILTITIQILFYEPEGDDVGYTESEMG